VVDGEGMKTAAVLVIKSSDGIEEFYIDMVMKSLMPYMAGIYVQDQGCTDNTMEVIRQTVAGAVPLIIEEEHNPLSRFDRNYLEQKFRNKAIERCEELFNPDWIVQNDADDFFTSFFFDKFISMGEKGELKNINSIFYATERFITPSHKSGWRGDSSEYGGQMWHDPHFKVWRAAIKCRYPVRESGFFHYTPITDCNPAFCMQGVCNIHLHRSFGPKAFDFWRHDGDQFENTIPFNPRKQAPKWFNSPQNRGSWIETDFVWPSYVLDKWAQWGDLTEDRRDYK
jgi:hypothetical protein